MERRPRAGVAGKRLGRSLPGDRRWRPDQPDLDIGCRLRADDSQGRIFLTWRSRIEAAAKPTTEEPDIRVLTMGIAGLFGSFLIPLLLIAAYRAITTWITGAPGHVGFPVTYGPETLALVGTVAVPLADAFIRRKRARRSAGASRSSTGRS
jgi:hypothetical protein